MQDARVLVIDDDEVLRDLICRRLERLGIDPDRAESGTSGLELLEQHPYDLIVTDIFMPGANGLDVLKASKEKAPLTQVIVITGGATIEMALEALDMGAFMYLTKPFDHLRVFDHAVENALRFRELLSAVEGEPIAAEMAPSTGAPGVIRPEAWLRTQEPRQSLEKLPFPFMVVSSEGQEVYANSSAQELVAGEWERTLWSVEELQSALERRASRKGVAIQIKGQPYLVQVIPMQAKPGEKGRLALTFMPQTKPSTPVKTGIAPEQLRAAVSMLKEGLAWLYGRRLMAIEFKVVRGLAQQVSRLEAVLASEGEAQWVEAEPSTEMEQDTALRQDDFPEF